MNNIKIKTDGMILTDDELAELAIVEAVAWMAAFDEDCREEVDPMEWRGGPITPRPFDDEPMDDLDALIDEDYLDNCLRGYDETDKEN
jgi:hypothetical protein